MRKRIATAKPVLAASDDFVSVQDVDDVSDALDEASDKLDDLQEAVSDVDEYPRDPVFEMENNIENHYIAECDRCHEVFISAVVESDSAISSVDGECPCCHEETTQELKWIVRSINSED